MTITRTAKGVTQNKTAASSWNALTNIAVCANATLIVGIAHDPSSIAVVTWNGQALTKAVSAVNGTDVEASLWALLSNSTSGTGTITVSWPAINITAKTLTAAQLNGVNTLDKVAMGNGAGATVASTGSTAVTSGVTFLAALAGIEGVSSDATGTWEVDADTQGQRDGTSGGGAATNITLFEGFALSLTSATRSAKLSGFTSRDWVAVLATFQQVDGLGMASALAVPIQMPTPTVTNTVGVTILLPAAQSVPAGTRMPQIIAVNVVLPGLAPILTAIRTPTVYAATTLMPSVFGQRVAVLTPGVTNSALPGGATTLLPSLTAVRMALPLPQVTTLTIVTPAVQAVQVVVATPIVQTTTTLRPALLLVPVAFPLPRMSVSVEAVSRLGLAWVRGGLGPLWRT